MKSCVSESVVRHVFDNNLVLNSVRTVRSTLQNYCSYWHLSEIWRVSGLTVYPMLSYCISSSLNLEFKVAHYHGWQTTERIELNFGRKRPALNCAKRYLRDSSRVSAWSNVVGLVPKWPTNCSYFWLCFYVSGLHHRLLHWGYGW